MKFIDRFSRKSVQQPPSSDSGQAPLLMALEPRIMFDASVGVVAQDAANQTTVDATKDSTSYQESSQSPAASASTDGRAQQAQRSEVVFVDGQVNDLTQLLSGLSANAEVVILDPSKDGLQQMADYLKGREGLDAIHLLSHGSDGMVQIGNFWLASNNLAEHRAALESIGSALKADGDLMLYGCRTGDGEKGQAFIDAVASITGADVAASVDDTGAASLGGNWTLERNSGKIETTTLGAKLAGYDAVLVSNYGGGANASSPLLTSGNIAKIVVGDFNNDGRDDILFQPGASGTAWSFASGNANGTFTVVDQASSPFANVTLIDAPTAATNYHVADFDGDGDMDLLAAVTTGGPAVYLYRNNAGMFSRETVSVSPGPASGVRIIAGDFNNDGAADFLYQATSSDPWRYMQNNGNGTFAEVAYNLSPFKNVAIPSYSLYNFRVADLDGDGDQDIIYFANADTSTLYINNSGTFTSSVIPITPQFASRAIVADLDGDGDADILYQNGSTTADWRYVLNNGNLTFTDMAQSASPLAGVTLSNMGSQNYRAGDFDGDGDLDLYTSVAGTAGNVYYQSGSTPRLVSATPADNSLSVSPTANIVLTFDQSVGKGDGNIYIVRTSDNVVVQTLAVGSSLVTGSGTTWTIDPPTDLAQGVAYAVRIDSKAFANADGKVYAGINNNVALNFTTASVQAPVIGNLNGDTVTFVEDSSLVLLDSGVAAVVTDADSLSFTNGKVTLQITGGGTSAEDVLLIRNQGSGLNQVRVDGSNLWYNGNIVGSYSGGANGSPLVINLAADATPVSVTAVLCNLAYRNTNIVDPSTTARSVSVTIDDGSGGTSAPATVTVNVVGVNDAPLVVTNGNFPVYTEGGSAVTLFNGTWISTGEAGQSVVEMVFTVANLNNGGSEKLVIDGTDVTLLNNTRVTTTGNSLTVLVSGTGGTVTVTLIHSGLSAATAQSIINTIAYRNDSQGPSGVPREVTLKTVRDSGGTANGGSDTTAVSLQSVVTVVGVNNAPTLTGSGGTLTWTEGNNTTSIPVVIDNAVTISDADGPYIASATVRISNNYNNGNDYLELVSNPATMGNIIGTWDAANGVLTLTSAGNQASLAQFQAALRAVTFTNLSESPTPGARTVQFQVNDGSLDSAGVIRSITMITVDDAPVISAPTSTLVVEDVATVINHISISDPDSFNIDMTLNVGSGTLAATSGAGVVVSGTSTAIKLSGTIDAVNAFIANNRLTYTTAANATADVTLTITVDNGSVAPDIKTMTLRVSPVNDAPVVTVPVSITVTEDLAGYLSGISFSDVDAGSASVTATFSVPSGTLSAISGSGVTVTDSGTATLTLSGSLSDINAFIAALSVKYQTALDNTSSVLLTVSINDNGNTGGSAQTDSKTVIINVNAVNDAPVNSVPAAQSTSQDVVLAFNSVKGNAISISDVDAGNSLMTVTLRSVNGTMTLSNTSGVILLIGTGVNNASIQLQGTLANLNTVLQSLTFKPTNGFLGSAQLTIESNDQGNTGSGGAKSSIDTIAISVLAANPKVTSVFAQGLDRTVKVGDEVLVNMVFDQAVHVDLTGGIPTLLLETGLLDRNAVYQSGSGSTTLVFKYTVQAGDVSVDLDFQSTAGLQLNGATLVNMSSDLAILTLPTVGGADSLGGRSNIVVDGVSPVVASVTSPSDGTYIAGQNLDFTVNFSESVVVSTVSGTPRIAVTLDTGGTVYADYVSGSGGSALVFRLTVASGQLDSNGITLGSAVQLNGGSISDVAGNDTVVTLNSVGSTANINVDGVAPAVLSVVAPGDGSYKAGDVLTFTVNASEGVVVNTSNGTPRLVLTVGGVTRYASYISGAAGGALLFQYTVQAGDTAASGLVVGNTLDLNGGTVRDPAGNALNLNLNGLSNAGNVLIDTTLPTASNLVRVDASPSNSGSVSYTLTFNENVSGVDASDFNLLFTGTASGNIASITQVDGRTYTILIDAIGGAGSLRLNLNASGTGIVDAAGNAIVGGLAGASYSIDRVAPSVVSVDVPAAGTYVAGQNLDFTVHLDEAVQLSVANGTPRIEVLLDNGTTAYATYLSGAGTNALVFRLTVANGQLDTNGITLGSAIQLNGATLRDSVGNTISVGLNGVDDTRQVRVDAVVPTVTTVGLPAPGAYNAGDVLRFTINTSESVIVDTSTGTPRVALNIGGLTRYATYVSGTGSNALVFEYTVESGNNAAGIGLAGTLDLNGGTVRDAAGNALNQGLNTQGGAGGVIVDTEAPQVSNIVRVDLSPTHSSSVRYTVTFNEDVNGVDSADFLLAFTGSASGRIASVEQVNGRTYTILVDNLAGAGNVRLDLSASGTGIVDVAGNLITGGLQGAVYSLDRVAPSVSSVDVPASGTYVAGQHLDFTVRTNETVLVDSGDGNPRLAITLDNGRVVYADYVSGSGGNALLFRLNVTGGMSGNSTFNVGSAIDFNGGSIRDAQGNDAQAGLNNVADTRGILLDAKAPRPSSIVVDGPVQPSDRTLNFTLTFDEAVSGVDAGDFGVVGTGNASGSVQSVLQIDAKTYRITVSNISGSGALALSLNALGSSIRDQVGNELAVSLIGQSQTIQSQDVGDLNYRLTPPQTSSAPSTVALQPQVPGFVATDAVSPLVSPGLFEVRTVGGNVQPLGTIFLGNGSSAPSFIAQVFGSSDGNLGGSQGGFGGGEGSVFGSSTFAGIFSREIPGVSEMNVFNGSQWKQSDLNQGLRGVFGAPTLGQQLHHINEAEQRQVRELATALAQPTQIGERA